MHGAKMRVRRKGGVGEGPRRYSPLNVEQY